VSETICLINRLTAAAEPIARERVGAALQHERSRLIDRHQLFYINTSLHLNKSSELSNSTTVPAHVLAESRPLIGGGRVL